MVTLGEILAECIDFEQLLLEGKDPLKILHYKFGAIIPEDIIDSIVEIDPTKKKSYSQWVLLRYKDEPNLVKASLKDGRLQQLFDYIREHNEVQIKDLDSLSEALDNYVPKGDLIFSSSEDEDADDYETVYDDEEWRICVPETYAASCKLGMDTRWCTANAYGNGKYYYDDYTSRGKLFVNFDKRESQTLNGKTFPYTRYQFHFESHSFMDASDQSLTGDELTELLPSDVYEYYQKEGYDMENFKSDEERWEEYDGWRYSHSVRINDNLVFFPYWDDDMEIIEDGNDIEYYIYDEDDDRDPITYNFSISCTFEALSNNGVIEGNDTYCIVNNPSNNTKYIITHKKNNNRYGRNDYRVSELEELIETEYEGEYIFLGKDSGTYTLNIINEDGDVSTLEATYGRISLNKQCSEVSGYDYCVEIDDSEIIQLYSINSDYVITRVIIHDIPANSEHYEVGRDGIVHGLYHSYRLFGNKPDGEKTFQVVKKLDIDNAVVEFDDDINKALYSIKERKIISNEPFNDAEAFFGCYVCVTGNKHFVLSHEGKLISNKYRIISLLKATVPILWGCNDDDKRTDGVLISPTNGEIFKAHKILGAAGEKYSFIIVSVDESGNNKIFDVNTNSLIDLGNYEVVNLLSSRFVQTLDKDRHLIVLKNKDVFSIYDIDNSKMILENLSTLGILSDTYFFGTINYYKVKSLDGSYNIFDADNRQLLFQNGYDNISKLNNHDERECLICILQSNGRNMYYDVISKRVVLTTNNTDLVLPIYASKSNISFKCQIDSLKGLGLLYTFDDNKFYRYNAYEPLDEESPEIQAKFKPAIDALGFMNTNSIKEQFDRFYKRISRKGNKKVY